MNRQRMFVVAAMIVVASLILSACGATPTVAPATQPPATVAPATQAPAPATQAPATAAPAATATSATSNPDTIIIGTTDKIASLDSADAYATHDWEILRNISDGLLYMKPGTTDVAPDLATDMGTISSDGLTYTYTRGLHHKRGRSGIDCTRPS